MMQGFAIMEIVLACIVVLILFPIAYLGIRRKWLSGRGWVFDCALRTIDPGSDWMLGVARLQGDTLLWYRTFSWSLNPKVVIKRGETFMDSTRSVEPAEIATLPEQSKVAILGGAEHVEVAMSPANMTALLSWLEASLPGVDYR